MNNCAQPRQDGFSLIELMIALVLGFLVVGAAGSVFVANRQAFRVSNNLAQVQENIRTAYELMARELRAAGGNPCGAGLIANVLNNSATLWWANWNGGAVLGYENGTAGDGATGIVPVGAGTGQRVVGTDAIVLLSGNDDDNAPITQHNFTAAQFKIGTDIGIVSGDIILLCDSQTAAILQVTNTNDAGLTIVHNTGTGTPGNCSKGLGFPTDCSSVNGSLKSFLGGMVVKVNAGFWYIGNNGRGGRSLFRASASGGTTSAQEMVSNVRDMQIEYLTRAGGVLATNWVAATGIYANGGANQPQWNDVVALRLAWTMQSEEAVGTDQQALQRKLVQVINLRNREM